ncbi:MAG: dihydropteroate synthase [Alistipes sp.]|nr:dihydropteroate synthase [Alistipes sp.]
MAINIRDIDFFKRQAVAIINVTDDSFYADSRTPTVETIEQRTEQVVAEGASIIDIGGYSSRPDAADIPLDEEWRRVQRGISAIRNGSATVPISVDTFRSEIIRRTVEEFGDVIVNDISAGELDDKMVDVVSHYDLPYVMMHMRGTPQTMQNLTCYDDVSSEVCRYLRDRGEAMVERGVRRERIILDPGFGFAKSVEQNFRLLADLNYLVELEYPVLVGLSRKSMIYKTLNSTPEDVASAVQPLHWEALRQGATLLRTHDVLDTVRTIELFNKFNTISPFKYKYSQKYNY